MERALLTVQGLRAWYDSSRDVLRDCSLELGEHEVVGLIGLNGAGKTTLLRTLSGLQEGFQAEGIWFEGRPVALRDKGFKGCRYTVFAEDHSFSYFTAREYLSYVFAAYGQSLPDVTALLRGFHFEAYSDVLLRDLSTGNRKKAFLTAAFALKPPLLLLDEPVNGLDFQSTEFLYEMIGRYREHGTVLLASHVLESLTLTCDRVLVLENGRIGRSFAGEQVLAAGLREALGYGYDL